MANLINCTVPFVTQLPHLDMFFVSGVRVGDLEVVAPSMEYTIYREGPMKGRVVYKPTGVHSVKLKSGGKEFVRFAVTNEYGAQMANIQPGLIGDCCGETKPPPTGTGSGTGGKSNTGSVESGAGAEATTLEAELKKRMNALAGKLGRAKTIEDITSHTQECNTLEAALDKALSENPNSAEVKRLKKEFEVAVAEAMVRITPESLKGYVDASIAKFEDKAQRTDEEAAAFTEFKRIYSLLDAGKSGEAR
eukprot:36405_1